MARWTVSLQLEGGHRAPVLLQGLLELLGIGGNIDAALLEGLEESHLRLVIETAVLAADDPEAVLERIVLERHPFGVGRDPEAGLCRSAIRSVSAGGFRVVGAGCVGHGAVLRSSGTGLEVREGGESRGAPGGRMRAGRRRRPGTPNGRRRGEGFLKPREAAAGRRERRAVEGERAPRRDGEALGGRPRQGERGTSWRAEGRERRPAKREGHQTPGAGRSRGEDQREPREGEREEARHRSRRTSGPGNKVGRRLDEGERRGRTRRAARVRTAEAGSSGSGVTDRIP